VKGLVIALFVLLAACGPDDHGASKVEHWYSKAEMRSDLLHKTKADIRDEWGSPDQVHDDENSWVYIRLPVKDEDAGTPVFMTTIIFAPGDDGKERATSIDYE
jgi:hypothetical protein